MVYVFLSLFNSRIAFLSTVDRTKNYVFSRSNLAKLPYSCPYLCLKSSTYHLTDAFGNKVRSLCAERFILCFLLLIFSFAFPIVGHKFYFYVFMC